MNKFLSLIIFATSGLFITNALSEEPKKDDLVSQAKEQYKKISTTEEFQKAVEKAKEEGTNLLEKAKEFFGFGKKKEEPAPARK